MLEKRLRERGLNAKVVNAGVSGFGTAEELTLLLENEGPKYKPVVVVGFFANDFEGSIRSGLFRLGRGKLVEAGKSMRRRFALFVGHGSSRAYSGWARTRTPSRYCSTPPATS